MRTTRTIIMVLGDIFILIEDVTINRTVVDYDAKKRLEKKGVD